MGAFRTFLTEVEQSTGPTITGIEPDSGSGIFVTGVGGSGKQLRLGPVSNINAAPGDSTGTRWVVTTDKGKFGVTMERNTAMTVVRQFYATKGVSADRKAPPQASPRTLWFHRGFRGDKYLYLNDEGKRLYAWAEQVLSWWVDNMSTYKDGGHAQPDVVTKAWEVQKEWGKMVKGQFFSSALSEAGGHGGKILSLQLPPEVYRKYLHQGAGGRGVGASLLIPGEDLVQLVQQYPHEENDWATAMQKYGNATDKAGATH